VICFTSLPLNPLRSLSVPIEREAVWALSRLDAVSEIKKTVIAPAGN